MGVRSVVLPVYTDSIRNEQIVDSLIMVLKNRPVITTDRIIKEYVTLNDIEIITNPDSLVASLNRMYENH